jgi:hypothetical protein
LVALLLRFKPHDQAILIVHLELEDLMPSAVIDREAVSMASPLYVSSLKRQATLMAEDVMERCQRERAPAKQDDGQRGLLRSTELCVSKIR